MKNKDEPIENIRKEKFWRESKICHTLYIYFLKKIEVKECHVLYDLN
jgi:hypothetical protein